MARTLKYTILSILKNYDFGEDNWTSPGELFAFAQNLRDYKGTQERLLQRAEELARQGIIESRIRGRGQNKWYRCSAQSSPSRKEEETAPRVSGTDLFRLSHGLPIHGSTGGVDIGD